MFVSEPTEQTHSEQMSNAALTLYSQPLQVRTQYRTQIGEDDGEGEGDGGGEGDMHDIITIACHVLPIDCLLTVY